MTQMITLDEKIHLFYIYEILEFNFCCLIEFYSSVSRSPFELNDGFPSLLNAAQLMQTEERKSEHFCL